MPCCNNHPFDGNMNEGTQELLFELYEFDIRLTPQTEIPESVAYSNQRK